MNKRTLLLRILGIIFIIGPFFINPYNISRLISVLLGIVILCISLLIHKKNILFKIIMYPLILFIILYGIDYILVYCLNRNPIFAYEFKSNDKISTYDSLIYRIYNCNNIKILDNFYRLNYACNETLEIKDINSFLSNIKTNYKTYHSKFVTIKGKISEIVGNDYILLQAYEQNTNLALGITFDKSTSLKLINSNDNLEFYGKYEIYDNVLVTGRIVKKDENTIIMHDVKIDNINNFDDFTLNIIESKNCKNDIKKLTALNDYNYYTNCLDDIYVKYDDETIYEMIFTLETKKMTFEKLIENFNKQEDSEKELYLSNNYNILKCKFSNNILIGNSSLKLNTKFCENFDIEEG